jgi:hypothetical protein
MRYLFGDSVPFPPQYDFLAALKVFVEQATAAARYDGEGRAAMEAAETDASIRSHAIEALESAHFAAMHALGTATTGGQPLIVDYAQKVQDYATALVAQTKGESITTAERAREAARAKTEHGRTQLRGALDALMIALRLPVVESRLLMDLADGRNDFQTVLTHSEGIATSFALSVDALDEWQKPRRVGDFTQGVNLPVGLKRSLFKRTVSHEVVSLDDYYLGGFDLADETVELRLRRKPDQKDAIVFELRHTDTGFYAEVLHPDDPDAASLEPVLDSSAASELERFSTLLRSACGPVVGHRSRVLSVALNGQDVFEQGLVPQLLATIVKIITPTVADISRRSGSPAELTLKTEDDDGKRQEIYVKKAELFARLAEVPPNEKPIFEPLRIALEARPETPPPPGVVAP